MTWLESFNLYGLVPADESLPAIRQLLAREAELEREGEEREWDLALLCCVQLFSRGYLEDVLRIWEAKRSGFDLFCYLDGEFLLGAGIEETKSYLKEELMKQPSQEIELALEYIDGFDLTDWSAERHLEMWRQYFQTQVEGET